MSLNSLKQEASSHNTPQQKLRELAAINDELARLVAANPVTDCTLLEELAIRARNNKEVEMQRALVSNPNTPTKWLIGLASLFPEEFFKHPAYSLSILENLNSADRFNRNLLSKLVCASNAPTSFLEFAAKIAETNIQRLRNDKYFEHLSLERQYAIYINKRLHKQGLWLGSFSFEKFWKLREILICIACHHNTSKKKLLELSKYGENVVAEVAQLRFDYPDDDINFWDKVACHEQPNLILFIPSILMFKLVQLPDISINFLAAASQLDTFPSILNIIANHPKTAKQLLDKLTTSNYSFVTEAAKLHINYTGELEIEWRDLAESKIDRTQLPRLSFDEEGIELRLWYAGAIEESTLPYLNQNSVYAYASTLLKIVCSSDTPQYILDNLENHPKVSQLITECITYLKQREAIIFDLLPQTLPIKDTKLSSNFAANSINPIITDLNTLFKQL